MTRKHIVVDYLTWMELFYIKNMLGAKSIDELIRAMSPYMRGGVMKLHKEVVEKEDMFLNAQYGGYPRSDEIGFEDDKR